MITYQDIKNNKEINTYIEKGNAVLGTMGFTDHGFAHAGLTAEKVAEILEFLNYDEKTVELAKIAGYMHDIGNSVNRHDHAQSGALMAFTILSRMDMEPCDIADIVCAIGNHDEERGKTVNAISAALILADKSDVRRSRVRQKNMSDYDIHDRVNYAVHKSELRLDRNTMEIILDLKIDNEISSVMDYFEIFLSRMMMCRRSAEFLGLKFRLEVNNSRLI